MHSRERGAAHVHILFFVFMLILFLGALGFAYLQMTEVETLRNTVASTVEENKNFRANALIRDHVLEDLKPLVGDTETYSGRANFNYVDTLGVAPSALNDVASAAKLRDRLNAFGAAVGVPDSQRGNLGEVLAYAKAALEKAKIDNETMDTARRTALSESAALRVAKDEAVAEANKTIADLKAQHDNLKGFLDTEFNKKQNEINAALTNVTQLRTEKNTLEAAHTKQVIEMTNVQDTLTAQNDALKNRMKLINPPHEADGEVISSSQAANLAWINLGRKDMLMPGTLFRITEPNSTAIKAYGTVTKVEQDRAEIHISGLKDRYTPVVKGDKIANDLYSPNVRRTVVLVGRFSYPLTKPVVADILRNLGNTVVDKPVPGVDLAIIGSDTVNETGDGFVDITETPEFKQIQFLSIETVTLNKVRDLLKL